MRILSIAIASGIAGLGLLVGSNNAQAANLVTNGSFETSGGAGQLGGNTSITGWTVPTPPNSYSFLFTPGSADTTGVNGSQYGNLKLWGPNDGSANSLPATSPDGGNYIAVDSAFQNNGTSSLSQALSGLTPGQQYTVSFYDAAAQQQGFTGPTFDQWQVSLGNQTLKSTQFNIASEGFSGWTPESLKFTANSASETLNFLATGGPNGLPPFALLDGVSVTAVPAVVPEPSFVWGLGAMMAFGLGAALNAKLALKK
ncbi:MAG: DUF642 domain-containing protein [Chroococcidiopsidaceae cyanobacterium CP_BM_ER_R8_30]|nr:DUF642 domain-containing protein [Chroococcidiopsidaceae cyanobacterium CP_BM_ER_R8_30]